MNLAADDEIFGICIEKSQYNHRARKNYETLTRRLIAQSLLDSQVDKHCSESGQEPLSPSHILPQQMTLSTMRFEQC